MSEELTSEEIQPKNVPQVTRESVDKFYRDSYYIGEGIEETQIAFYQLAEKAGCLSEIKDITRGEISDAVPPVPHENLPDKGTDDLRMKTRLMMTANGMEASKKTSEELGLDVLEGMLMRNIEYTANGRPARNESGSVKADSAHDKYSSTIRRVL